MAVTRLSRVLAATVLGAGIVAWTAAPSAAQQGPPGNNGTVKIDDVEFDDHPNNEPHVGCVFQVDFYNYDADTPQRNLQATVLFEAWPPTGNGQDLLTDAFDIGEDPNGGGTDLDASRTYDLSDELAGFTPSQQGFHVRLTVHADGSQGADTKHKVFWVSGCGGGTTTTSSSTTSTSSSTTSSSTTTSTTTSSTTSTTVPSTTSSSTTTTTPGSTTSSSVPESTTTTAPGQSTTTSVPGTAVSTPGGSVPPGGPGAPAVTPTTALPRTGTTTLPALIGGLALIALGTGAVLGARHLRGATRH
jgi:hypothetical protein